MTMMEFAGCAMTAYGPAFFLFILTIMQDPVRIIILVVSAFFWLLALLFSSLFWNFIALRHVLFLCIIVSVLIQEAFRFCVYFLLRKAESGLKKIRVPNTNIDLLSNRQIVPYVAGLGYGIMSGGFSLVNILAELSGPGTMGPSGWANFFCLVTSVFTMMFTFLHMFWSIIFFSAVDAKNYYQIGWVVGSHLFVSCITMLNESRSYELTILPTLVILLISGYIAFSVCRDPRSSATDIVVQNH